MRKFKVTSRIYFRNMLITYAGISVAVLLIPAAFYFVRNQPDYVASSNGNEEMLAWVALGAALPAFGLSILLFKRMVAVAATEPRLEYKLKKYKSATIIALALAEVPAILGAIGYYLTGFEYLLLTAAASVMVMSLFLPARNKVAERLQLDERQRGHINNPEYLLYEVDMVEQD
jgi:hypothetical protein